MVNFALKFIIILNLVHKAELRLNLTNIKLMFQRFQDLIRTRNTLVWFDKIQYNTRWRN